MVFIRSGASYLDPSLFRTTYSRYRSLDPAIEPKTLKGDFRRVEGPVVPPPIGNSADAMMALRGLPIVMPLGLALRPMPVHLPKFSGMAYEDPSNHIERYIEVLMTNVIPDETYRLVLFSTTLEGATYDWYRSHALKTFANWPTLQTTFLRQFKPAIRHKML